jgi:hypothetical protein
MKKALRNGASSSKSLKKILLPRDPDSESQEAEGLFTQPQVSLMALLGKPWTEHKSLLKYKFPLKLITNNQ